MSIFRAAMTAAFIGASACAVVIPAAAHSSITVDFGDVAIGYQDGYYDGHHHWHHWKHSDDYKSYSQAHPEHYHDYGHRDHGHDDH